MHCLDYLKKNNGVESLRGTRQTGTWNPLPKGCNACTWTHFSLSNKIQTNCMETKCMYVQLGQILDKGYKETQNPKCHF